MPDPKQPAAPLPELKRAEIALASQGRPACTVLSLTAEQVTKIAATVTPNGFTTGETVAAVAAVYREYLDVNKATDAEFDASGP